MLQQQFVPAKKILNDAPTASTLLIIARTHAFGTASESKSAQRGLQPLDELSRLKMQQ